MKLFRHNVMIVVMAAVAALFAAGCADDGGVDNRELDYGYVQFKLYKEASAPVSQPDAVSNDTRAVVDELDYLADACKIEIRLLSGSTTIAQTLTLVPDIFSSKTDYIMSGVEFAYNDITGFENGNNGKYQGINVSTLTLSGNRIKQFPACLAKSASQINYIIMSGNGMTGFEEGSFTPAKAENLANLISIDLTYNRLTELPDDFHAGNMPYLYGVDLSSTPLRRSRGTRPTP